MLVTSVLLFAGCDSEAGTLDEERIEPEAQAPVALGEPAVFPEAPLVASGRLELESSPISPWCGAVLVAPDVAVTATHCVAGHYPEAFSVAFGDPSMAELAPRATVADVIAETEATLAILVLEKPVVAIAPATLADDDAGSRCGAAAVSHEYVAKHEDDPGARWLVTGCLDGEQLDALDDTPNCHGEQGSGVFVDGSLVGITIGMGDAFDGRGCAAALRVARLDRDDAVVQAALALAD